MNEDCRGVPGSSGTYDENDKKNLILPYFGDTGDNPALFLIEVNRNPSFLSILPENRCLLLENERAPRLSRLIYPFIAKDEKAAYDTLEGLRAMEGIKLCPLVKLEPVYTKTSPFMPEAIARDMKSILAAKGVSADYQEVGDVVLGLETRVKGCTEAARLECFMDLGENHVVAVWILIENPESVKLEETPAGSRELPGILYADQAASDKWTGIRRHLDKDGNILSNMTHLYTERKKEKGEQK